MRAEAHALGIFSRPLGDSVLGPAAMVSTAIMLAATAIMLAAPRVLVWLGAFGCAVEVDGRVRFCQALAGRNSAISVP